jgi:uncharacterized membrane protein YeaQ/YmgE (transglycosylase-associated protein family)
MNFLKAVIFGALIGYCGVLLHNFMPPFGFLTTLILTFLGIKVVRQRFFYLRYQIYAAAAWLAVVVRAGTPGNGDEILVYGNTYGNLFLLGGFISIVLALFTARSKSY